MKTLKTIGVVLMTVLIIAATAFFLAGYYKPKPAGIRVDAVPAASVYIDGQPIGKTPLKQTLEAAPITLRLVPDDASKNFLPYETKITLTSGIETVVRREFGTTEDTSSGDVISFIKSEGKSVSLVVVSSPDNAQVSLDGVTRGFSPYKNLTISPAQHQITVKAPGYRDRVMTVNTLVGYQLTVFAKLAKGVQEESIDTVATTPSPTPTAKTYVEILKTPTGFLRVRTLPGTLGEEIAEVKPGEKYLYLETDSASGWYKIQYQEPAPGLPNGITGWVSNQYSQVSTESGILKP
jgi:uncharacterized protein YgiM (DUF1202 family)